MIPKNKNKKISGDASGLLRMSPDGRAWFTNAVDPFHDKDVPLRDMPDMETSQVSIVRIRKQVNLTADPGQSGPWRACVFFTPEMYTTRVYACEKRRGYTRNQRLSALVASGSNVTTFDSPGDAFFDRQVTYEASIFGGGDAAQLLHLPLGFCNVWQWGDNNPTFFPAGDNTWGIPETQIMTPFPEGTSNDDDVSFLDTTEVNTRMRVISCGFEIRNTSSALQQGGAITCVKFPITARLENFRVTASGDPSNNGAEVRSLTDIALGLGKTFPHYYHAGVVTGLPPASIQEAVAYPSSVTMEAKEGAYCVPQIHATNPLGGTARQYRVFESVPVAHAATLPILQYNPTALCTPTHRRWDGGATYVTSSTGVLAQQSQFVPMDGIAAYLSGLDEKATFTVTMHCTLAIAARPRDPTYGAFMYSSSFSAAFDARALYAYAIAMARMPAGVPVRMNASGDFWRRVLSIVNSAMPYLDAATLVPGVVGDVARVATAAARVAIPAIESAISRNGAAPPAQAGPRRPAARATKAAIANRKASRQSSTG